MPYFHPSPHTCSSLSVQPRRPHLAAWPCAQCSLLQASPQYAATPHPPHSVVWTFRREPPNLG